MATITKTKAGTFKAIIRKNNRVIKTKIFRLKKDARTWSKRIEGNRDAMTAFVSPCASIQFNQLADEYLSQWTGKDNITTNVKFWKAQLDDTVLINIDATMIRDVLNRYGESEALCGLQRTKTGRKRSP
jgi:hypothetical protein